MLKRRVMLRLGLVALSASMWVQLLMGQSTEKQMGATKKAAVNASVESNLRARKVIDAALEAAGGREALKQITTAEMKFDGELIHRNQSHRPEAPYERTRTWGEMTYDAKANRMVVETRGSWVGGFNWGGRNVLDGKQGTFYDVINKRATLAPETFNADQARQDSMMQRFPFAALLHAASRERDVRYVGEGSFQGKRNDIVTFPGPRGDLWTLYIDSASHMVSKYEQVIEDPVVGDTVREVAFSDYRKEGPAMIATKRDTYVAGELTGQAKVTEAKLNAPIVAEVFAAPAGYPEAKAQPKPGDAVTKFGENVYMFRTSSNYNVLLVGFKDHVMVMEAPGSPKVAKEILAKAKELFPGKPVTEVAVTHFHDDHAGAAKGFIEEGVTLLTTSGNLNYFKQVASYSSTATRQGTKIETINGKRTLSDGSMTVELIDIGKGPHTDEMLVAYIPGLKLVFQGDLLNRPADGLPQAGNDTTAHFAKRVSELGLEVDAVAGVHGPPGTKKDLETAVAMYEAGKVAEQKVSQALPR
jgi:glyoxylase-like metal-dependent hydrolase (beta-lactamase superfamily II)